MAFFSPFGGTNAPGQSTGMATGQIFSGIGNAVSDLFAAEGANYKIQGLEAEQQEYEGAAALAEQNVGFTTMSTAIQEAQANRELFLSMGRTQGQVAGAGFAASGSALDILRSSASQGALQTAVLGEQGLITEAGYQEQAQSYAQMANAAGAAIQGEKLAQEGSLIGAGISGASSLVALASLA
jgi:hypothetical protein